MRVSKKFYKGREVECGTEFFEQLPLDHDLYDAIDAVTKIILDNVLYKEFFELTVDTEKMTAEVTGVA